MSRSRVKILKTELWDNDIPALCMICGEEPAQTRHEMMARHVFFPLNLLGIIGQYATPKKMPMSVACCNKCKAGYLNEVNMQMIWQSLRTLALVFFIYTFTVKMDAMPKALLPPVIFAAIVVILEFVYFAAIGNKSAVRVAKMDEGTVSLDLPAGKWAVAYTTYKREKNQKRKATQAPIHDSPPPTGGDSAPPPPAGTPTISQAAAFGAVGDAPDFRGIAFEGSEQAQVPSELSPLLMAIKLDDSDKLEKAIKDGGDLNEKLANGMNALHIAALGGGMQMAMFLLGKGIPVNSEMGNGLTPLHLAVQANNQSLVGMLLAKKADPNHANADGRTPLHWCAAVADDRLDPNNRYKMANILVKGGGDINAKDKNGKTPADLAKEAGDPKVAEAFS